MCGIVGLYSQKGAFADTFEAMIHLQHRGQDAAGIVTFNKENGKFAVHKDQGLVNQIFEKMKVGDSELLSSMALGHLRYPTNGSAFDLNNAQPMLMNYPYGIAMVHNGDLSNYESLKKQLAKDYWVHANTGSDLETLMSLFSIGLSRGTSENKFENICKAVEFVYSKAKGGYSVIAIIAGIGMVAFRDPHGIRPLVMGERINYDGKKDYIFSSENGMYYALGFTRTGDVGNGEVVFIDKDCNKHTYKVRNESFTPDVFEYVYFARPDAVINDISVYRSRLRMGQNIAKKWKTLYPGVIPDVVVPVPFSSNSAALSVASYLGVRYTEGIYKNPFVGRTFIMPTQNKRQKSIFQKLSPQITELKGKKVMLVDDSIVRGTTSRDVVKMVRDAGASEIYFLSAAPPLFYPHFYGIAIPTQDELIASKMTQDEIRKFIGADILLYQDIEGIKEAVLRKGSHEAKELCMPYFDGYYITDDINTSKFRKIDLQKFNNENIQIEYDTDIAELGVGLS
jgi:amidophosphoribosyltransferase